MDCRSLSPCPDLHGFARWDAMGVGRNDRVALALPKGLEMVVAFMAVASRGTCAPLNPGDRHP